MKKYFFVLLAVTALLVCLCFTVGATAPADPEAASANDACATAPLFQQIITIAVSSILPTIASISAKMGIFGFVPYLLILAGLTYLALAAYRFYVPVRLVLGAVAGFFVGYIGWHVLILAVADVPAFILNYERLFYVLTLLVSTVLGAVIVFFLRRVGIALAVSVTATILICPFLVSPVLFWGLFFVFLVLSLLANKQSVIMLTSFACPIFALYLMVGPGGFYPLSLAGFLTTTIEPVLLVGVALGAVCMVVQNKICRAYR